MIVMSIKPNPPLGDWEASLQASEQQIKKAAVRALNKTARWARPVLARQVSEELGIKVSFIRKGLTLIRARANRPESGVGLNAKSGVVNAIDLGNARQTETGVSMKGRQWDRAFIATMPSGHKGIYRRRQTSRLPIDEIKLVFTGRLATAMDDLADQKAYKRFETIFERELRFIRSVA